MPGLSCVICSEVYRSSDVICSTSCGHVFHFQCLQQWQSRETSCPQCRFRNPQTHKLYIDFDETATDIKLNETKAQLDLTEKSRSELQLQLDVTESNISGIQILLSQAEDKILDLEYKNDYLKAQNDSREQAIAKAAEESEDFLVKIASLEDNFKEVLLEKEKLALEMEKRVSECTILKDANNKLETLVKRNENFLSNTRKQYEAVESALKVKVEQLKDELITKSALIQQLENRIREIGSNKQNSQQYSDQREIQRHNTTEIIIQKLKLEKELEQTLDKIVELENNHIRDIEFLNLEIDSLKADNERKDNEIANRKEEHAKMMTRLTSLGSKATEMALRKRIELLNTKLEETRSELESSLKNSAELNRVISKIKAESKVVEGANSSVVKYSSAIQPQNTTASSTNQIAEKCEENTSVVIRGVCDSDIKNPLADTVLMLTEIMNLPCTAADIKDVFKLNNTFKLRNNIQKDKTTLVVAFTTLNMKIKFLENKSKLRNKALVVSAFVDNETNKLFHYAKSLKSLGYHVFCKNNSVFARVGDNSQILKINSKLEVDNITKNSNQQISEKHKMSLTGAKHKSVIHKKKEDENAQLSAEECDEEFYRK
ncbi:E3 ubiquitin-protein ligase TRAIP [Bactrocera dorsalis]|uniref:E3 ubiquitin-protein ligase TRAIP n=1 Tax=Bactrocera dorsalis TaxID=27457 RepID=A0ABM3JTR5_BACDO|nr:E3 ubiquitin-protein ligase TRAIP [Bactrocera dorsalis]